MNQSIKLYPAGIACNLGEGSPCCARCIPLCPFIVLLHNILLNSHPIAPTKASDQPPLTAFFHPCFPGILAQCVALLCHKHFYAAIRVHFIDRRIGVVCDKVPFQQTNSPCLPELTSKAPTLTLTHHQQISDYVFHGWDSGRTCPSLPLFIPFLSHALSLSV